ncbi:uncharacterized protein LOC124408606 [Diprion similis]|uniref:uncharacterized protein LOC124408606 n=1 Tax=Diprion similis TaxID=362088 RepID=UPI001EF7EF40|nr:uncharacterized protein LOC124408606 [Diprion similis]
MTAARVLRVAYSACGSVSSSPTTFTPSNLLSTSNTALRATALRSIVTFSLFLTIFPARKTRGHDLSWNIQGGRNNGVDVPLLLGDPVCPPPSPSCTSSVYSPGFRAEFEEASLGLVRMYTRHAGMRTPRPRSWQNEKVQCRACSACPEDVRPIIRLPLIFKEKEGRGPGFIYIAIARVTVRPWRFSFCHRNIKFLRVVQLL